MRTNASVRSTLFAVGTFAVIAASEARSANVPHAVRASGAHVSSQPAQKRAARPHGAAATPFPCATNFPNYSFDGIPSASDDVAGGDHAGVVSGYANFACDADSAVAGGESNTVGSSSDDGTSDWSTIAGGESNLISNAQNAFIGAGEGGSVLGAYSFIGAGSNATVSGGYSFAGAGNSPNVSGSNAFAGAGLDTVVSNDFAFDGAGLSSIVSGLAAFVGAGYYAKAEGSYSFAGAGFSDLASGNGSFAGAGDYAYSTTCGGSCSAGNTVSGTDSFLGAGDQNSVSANEAFVGSGGSNAIASSATYATILGGLRNSASGEYASVLGGYGNSAGGSYAIVAGGNSDSAAGTLTFAAGYHAGATHNGSFVWSDYSSGSTTVKDTAANQFVIRASGGTYVYSNEAATSGVTLAPGSGTWSSLSDRNAKTDIAALDDDTVLRKVDLLPVRIWRYRSERGVRHVGPMAQDFYAAFGVGEDDRHIASIDEDGVALAAVKGLSHKLDLKLREKDAEIASLSRNVRHLDAVVAALLRARR